jgi:hypothetical protein
MALMYSGAQGRVSPQAAPTTGDGGGFQPQMGMGMPRQTPQMQLQQAAENIRQMEMQFMDMQRKYGMMQTQTSNPQQLFAMQSEMQKLQQQIQMAKQSAQQMGSMAALQAQQRSSATMSPSVGQGSRPNQGYADQAQQIRLLTNMFGGGAGAGADRMW